MSEPLKIDKSRSALLIMDYENDIIARFVKNPAELLDRAANLIRGAREAGIPVIYLAVRFRAGYPEINPKLNIRVLRGIRAAGILLEGTPGSEIAAQVALQQTCPVVEIAVFGPVPDESGFGIVRKEERRAV